MPDRSRRLTREEVEKIAALANLELDPAEIDLFARQLGDILVYVGELNELDTSDVRPTTKVAGPLTQESDRPDEIRASLDRDAALANAPDAAHDTPAGSFFKVPRVIG
jgi:aspartyl-tRNA(Asn)/glutamyl-tRNA(Gln) amidotransferase subunit C